MVEGGEVYKRLFLFFRYAPGEDESPTETALRENEMELRGELMGVPPGDPDYGTAMWIYDAAMWLQDYERYEKKFPYAGGLMEQPYIWKLALDCALAARDGAKHEKDKQEAEQQEAFGGALGERSPQIPM